MQNIISMLSKRYFITVFKFKMVFALYMRKMRAKMSAYI